MRRRLLAIAAVTLTACSDSGPSVPVGTYTLVSIGGRALPTQSASDANVTYGAGAVALQTASRCTVTTTAQLTGAPPSTESSPCTWSMSGTAVTLVDVSTGQVTSAVLTGRELRASIASEEWLFVR